jgi:hypothetical protein
MPRQRHPRCAAQAVHAARCIFGVVEINEDLPRPSDQKLPAPGQAGHYCSDWNVGDLCDIAIVQLIDFPQDNYFTKLRRQLCQGALNLFGIRLEKCDLLGSLDFRSVQAFVLKFLLLRRTQIVRKETTAFDCSSAASYRPCFSQWSETTLEH